MGEQRAPERGRASSDAQLREPPTPVLLVVVVDAVGLAPVGFVAVPGFVLVPGFAPATGLPLADAALEVVPLAGGSAAVAGGSAVGVVAGVAIAVAVLVVEVAVEAAGGSATAGRIANHTPPPPSPRSNSPPTTNSAIGGLFAAGARGGATTGCGAAGVPAIIGADPGTVDTRPSTAAWGPVIGAIAPGITAAYGPDWPAAVWGPVALTPAAGYGPEALATG